MGTASGNESVIQEVDATVQRKWDALVSHPLQSWAWGEFRKSMGIDIVRLGTCQLSFHTLPKLPWTIGYFPKGPMPTKELCEALVRIGKQKNAIFIQLEPNALNISPLSIVHCPLIPSHHPLFTRFTYVIDLTKSEKELLSSMHYKTRYNIRLAERHGVVVKEDNSLRAFSHYLELTSQTTQRQEFYAHNQTYHRNMWDAMKKAGIAHLFTATYKRHVLATWIIFAFKDTIYYPYGASSREYREVMAPNLMLWELIKWGKTNGFKKFDLWGALGPTPDPNDPWYGFHRFKEGYRPELVEFIGSYDLVIHPLLYKLYCIGDLVRWKVLKLKTKLF